MSAPEFITPTDAHCRQSVVVVRGEASPARMTRSATIIMRQAWSWALLAVLCLGAPVPAGELPRPGIVELDGSWRLSSGDGRADGVWRPVSLPADGAALGATAGGGSLWLRRELNLGDAWQRRLAPSGLAVLIRGSAVGNYLLLAAERPIGSWQGPRTGIVKPATLVFDVPEEAVDQSGRLQLSVRWQWRGWALPGMLRRQVEIGDGWLLGDKRRLEIEAGLALRRDLNSDLPSLILILLYAAIGSYYLQIFRRDQRRREYLWFGLTALIVAAHCLLHTYWAVALGEYFPALGRLYLVVGAGIIATSIQFLWPFLSSPIGGWLRAYQLSSPVLAGLLAALPGTLFTPAMEVVSRSWGIPFLIAVATLLVRRLRQGSAEARAIAFAGFSIVAVSMVEIMFQLFGPGSLFPLQAYALAFFSVSIAFSLSNRFSRVNDELLALRQQLEDMVEDRTAELSAANQKLQSEIAERELAQEAMRMLERAVEQSIDGILVADLDEETLFVNDAWARLHGRGIFEILGRRLSLFHSREQIEQQLRPALDKVKKQGSWEGEIAHLGKDGSVFPTWMSVTLLRDPEAEPVGFVMVGRDISERTQAAEEKQRIEARIQEAEKLRSLADLASGIAHDYNNMLTGVLGNSSLAMKELPAGSQAREKLTQIGNAAERAADLTAQLLAYAGVDTPILKRTDLEDLIVESRAELERCAGTSAQVELELDGSLPAIEIDAAQVLSAVLSLVAEAAASVAGKGDGSIKLKTGLVTADSGDLAGGYGGEDLSPGVFLFIRVEDNGGRFDHDQQRQIFDPLSSNQGSARNLGLAAVLSTARVHRGLVKVSNRPGGGAISELWLPVDERVAETPASAQADSEQRGSGTVLVVDDEFIMREVSRSILEQSGFDVLATGKGQEALELYRRHMAAIRLVLLDRTMPSMPGEEVLERILNMNPDARVLLMSGYSSDSIVRELIDQGKAEFLAKPFRPEELVEKVCAVIG